MATSLLNSTLRYMKRVCIRFFRSGKLWLEYDGGVFSAAVAFYAALSAFPAFLVLNTIVRFTLSLFQVGDKLNRPMLDAIEAESSQQLRIAVEQTIASPDHMHHVGGILGIVWLFFMSLLVFAQIDRGFKRLWAPSLEKPASLFAKAIGLLVNRTRAMLLLFGFGLITALIFVLRVVSESVASSLSIPDLIVWMVNSLVHIVVHTSFFALVYKRFSPMTVKFNEALKSALVLAICLELGRWLVAQFVVRDYSTLYGISGSFIIILLWIYYTSTLIFFSAAYLRVLVDERESMSLTLVDGPSHKETKNET